MVRLLIYGYTTGVRSSRAIQRKCVDDVAFRSLAADQAPPRTPRPHPGPSGKPSRLPTPLLPYA